ncbi:MAG TPA: PTS sugar transporter subunit IIA [Terriglobales bacterium]|nr:PTS sugar transporter subunit IIA [Terriglobales bacterium]
MTNLSQALSPDAILVPHRSSSFEGMIDALLGRLALAGRIPQALTTDVRQTLCQREQVSSTAMVDIGVSIPHARIEGVDGVAAALAVHPAGVYHVGDGLPISIVVLVLSSPRLTTEHLTFLSSLSMLLQSERVRQQLKEALSSREVMLLLQEHRA